MKIAIIDDNSFSIASVKERLSFFDDVSIVFTADDGSDLLKKLEQHKRVELLLMDIEMPVLNGIEATQIVKQKYPHIKIVMLTTFDNDDNIFNAIKAGADGYLLKEINPRDLYDSLTDTLTGGAAMTPSIAFKTLKLLRNNACYNSDACDEGITLTTREIEVLEQLSKGLSYTVIADHLFISPSTVRKHVENIYKKLQVHSKIEAVEKARRNNLI
tara:strand:+ start:1759 stop:2403 length:645 start_codon:yes stop_codon:yes gene_type:complete